ncbi:uncharacterized protein LOC114342259 isoform X1 [Diabrotica virgifera virgifera]|uniref:Ubiquitin-like protease family profile domain-containing protein n=2 Tax=Diabrotica virgifera virgifera TaxID=50390 RepID=A0ABM5IYD3_DIAVI|nr:uncharacterized protein LOC114342259 isoform X1 [Diabrotica virgifera virgifera]
MAQPQYFEVLNNSNKNQEQHFFSNIEDSTVQYVITPDNTQVQLPSQQIPNQIVQTQIVQQSLIQQPIQIQTPQYTLIKDGTIRTTEGQQIFFVENAITTDGIVIEKQIQHTQQPIVLNHQISQPAIARAPLMKPTLNQQVSLEVIQKQKPMQRPPNPNQNQARLHSPSVGQIRQIGNVPNKTPGSPIIPSIGRSQIAGQTNLRHGLVRTGQSTFRPQTASVRQTEPNQVRLPIRTPNQVVSNRPSLIRSPVANTINQRLQGLSQHQPVQVVQQPSAQLSKFISQGSSASDTEMKSEDQEAVSLPDGTVVSMTSYKKMLADQKARNTPPKQPVGQQNNQIHQATNLQQNSPLQPNSSVQSTNPLPQSPLLIAQNNNLAASRRAVNTPPNKPPTATKKRNPSPRVPRAQQPKTPKAPRGRAGSQANQQQQQQQSNTPGHFSMLSQQHNANKPQQQQFSSPLPALASLSQPQQQSQIQQQVPMQSQQKQQLQSQLQSSQQQQQNQVQPSQQQNQMQPSQQQNQMQTSQQQQQNQMQPSQQQQQKQMQLPQQQQQAARQPSQQQQQHQQSPSPAQMQQNQQARARGSQANYVIQPPKLNQKPANQRPLPAFVPSSHIQKIIEETPLSEEFADSIRMLVLLENGEQRLITFTLPKEACTIQEILEQVNVPFNLDTNIQVMETNSEGINYIVTVGNMAKTRFGLDDSSSSPQEATPVHTQEDQYQVQQPQTQDASSTTQKNPPEPPKSPVPPPVKETPKLVKGMLAVCACCGFLSEDFNKCQRCFRKLPDTVKAMPDPRTTGNAGIAANPVGQKRDIAAVAVAQQQKHQAMLQQQQQQAQQGQQQKTTSAAPAPKVPSPQKRKATRSKTLEDSVHVISSDEEEEESPKLSENLLQKLGNSVTISPKSKEPSLADIQRHLSKNDSPTKSIAEKEIIRTKVHCRTVRIGSYRCIPLEDIVIDSEAVTIKVPHPHKEKGVKTITFAKCDTVKVLVSFNSSLPVIFYYLNPSAASQVRTVLDMMTDSDYYYDPLSLEDEVHRRLTLLPDDLSEENKNAFQTIYSQPASIFEELNIKEANDILIKTCPKDVARPTPGFGAFAEIKQLLTYPPEGRYRLTINTEDYMCLAQDQFLNDVIIDFYLTYLVDNLPPEQKSKIHVFSTFFYKRLTTKPTKASRKSQPSELDPTLSPAQKRHARVKKWSKNVNIFEKDFVIVPINENAHWFLAIICFPGMSGCHTWDGKPYKLEVISRKKKPATTTVSIANVTVAIKQEKLGKAISCDDPELSDKDEAEGDDSEMESDDSEELPLSQNGQTPISTPTSTTSTDSPVKSTSTPTHTSRGSKEPRLPIKQPCILIFDSLSGASRCRVVATLRDYLTCEYKSRMGSERVFNKDVIKGASPKVPQQNNFTDCGLYLLQYVEQFFKDPIKDFRIPIKEIQNWFEEITVTKKREDIAILIKTLMREYGKDLRLVPDNIMFPTLHGKIVEHEMDDEEEDEEEMMEEEEEEEEESFDTSKDDLPMNSSKESLSEAFDEGELKGEETGSPIKPSNEAVPSDFVTQRVVNPKPDVSEFSLPRQTNRDTLSILKAKRIVRHRNTDDGPSLKKPRNGQD